MVVRQELSTMVDVGGLVVDAVSSSAFPLSWSLKPQLVIPISQHVPTKTHGVFHMMMAHPLTLLYS